MTMLINQRESAITAYQNFLNSPQAPKQRDKVFKAFELLEFASDWEVHKFTGIGIRQVSARRSECGDKIIEAGTRKDKDTGNLVCVWKINPFPSMFPTKKISSQKRMKLLRDLIAEKEIIHRSEILSILNS